MGGLGGRDVRRESRSRRSAGVGYRGHAESRMGTGGGAFLVFINAIYHSVSKVFVLWAV